MLFLSAFQKARKVTSQPFTYDDSVIEVVIGQLVTAEDLLKQARTLCQAEGEEFGTRDCIFSRMRYRRCSSDVYFTFSTVKHKLKPDDLTEAAASDDIVPAFMQNITLLCPLTLSRMTHPGRGAKCEHLQCFDLLSYLKVRESSPTNDKRASNIIFLSSHHFR